jgi:hypothetical protein
MPIDTELIRGLGMARYTGEQAGQEALLKRGLMKEQLEQAPLRTKRMEQQVATEQMALEEKQKFVQFQEAVKNEWLANPGTDVNAIIQKKAQEFGLPAVFTESYQMQNKLLEEATKTMTNIYKVYGPEKAQEFAAKDPNLKDMGTPNFGETAEGPKVVFDVPGLPEEAKGRMGFVIGKDGKISPFKIERGEQTPLAKVEVKIGEKGMTEMAKQMGETVVKEHAEIEKTVENWSQLQELKGLINAGVITGFGAEWMVKAGKALQQMGIHLNDDAIANTEAYAGQMGRQVGQIIKQFGSGTGLSDADREYAEKIVGGKITLTEKSMRKIIDLNEKAIRNVVMRYNVKADKIMSKPEARELPYDLRIQLPRSLTAGTTTQTQPPEAGGKESLRQRYNY